MGLVPFFFTATVTVPGKEEQLQALLEPTISSLGFELWGLELHASGKHSLLRIYIDGPDGINVENCAQVSRHISSVLDVEDPIAQNYTLEVSSPGLERPLYTLAQFTKFIGSPVAVRLRSPFEGKRNFIGQLNGVEDQDVVVMVDDHEYLLPIDLIDKAHLHYPIKEKE